jgi:hypothetical protein
MNDSGKCPWTMSKESKYKKIIHEGTVKFKILNYPKDGKYNESK